MQRSVRFRFGADAQAIFHRHDGMHRRIADRWGRRPRRRLFARCELKYFVLLGERNALLAAAAAVHRSVAEHRMSATLRVIAVVVVVVVYFEDIIIVRSRRFGRLLFDQNDFLRNLLNDAAGRRHIDHRCRCRSLQLAAERAQQTGVVEALSGLVTDCTVCGYGRNAA